MCMLMKILEVIPVRGFSNTQHFLFLFYRVVDILLKRSCRFLEKDKDGNNALHLVCQNGHTQTMERLLQPQIGWDSRLVIEYDL